MTHRGRTLSALVAAFALTAALAPVQPAAQVTSAGDFRALDSERPAGALPNRIASDVGIVERLGVTAPTDGVFLDEAGREVRLADVLGRERPVMLAFVYHSCPMLCSLILDGVAEAVGGQADLRPGRDYDVVAVSIDPRDTPALASEAKARYVAQIGDPAVADGMHFWTVTDSLEASAKTLAGAVGWNYAWDAATQEYAHNAAVVLLSPSGVVTRYLYGVQYEPRDVRLALVEAGDGTVGSTVDRFLLTCYEFDDASRTYAVAALGLLKIGGAGLLLALGGLLFVLWRREARRQQQAALSS